MNSNKNDKNLVEGFYNANIFWFLITLSIILILVGIYLGNPFETYNNASEL